MLEDYFRVTIYCHARFQLYGIRLPKQLLSLVRLPHLQCKSLLFRSPRLSVSH